jgi:hypothetical protein
VFNKLGKHLQVNNILVPEQFGFRKDISIERVVFTLRNNILKLINRCKQTGGIFCHLAKAFDCVYHKILLGKLCYYSIHGVNAHWFESYLVNRKQKVEMILQNEQKNVLQIGEYINDLPLEINTSSKPELFADDIGVLSK